MIIRKFVGAFLLIGLLLIGACVTEVYTSSSPHYRPPYNERRPPQCQKKDSESGQRSQDYQVGG